MEIVIGHWNRFMVSRVVLESFCVIKHGSLMITKMVQMEPLIFFLWPKTASETAFCSEGVNNGGNSWRGWVHHQLPYLSCSHRKRISFYYLVVLLCSRSKEKRYDEGNKTESTPETLSLFLFCRRLSFIETKYSNKLCFLIRFSEHNWVP